MALTLCPNCRLPVNSSVPSCPLCTQPLTQTSATRNVSVAAAVAVVATTVALVARRWA